FGSFLLDNVRLIRKFDVKYGQRRLPVKWCIAAVRLLADVAEHSVFYPTSDRILETVRVEQPRKLRRCEERVTSRFSAPLLKCRRPIPNEEVGADRGFEVALLPQPFNNQVG